VQREVRETVLSALAGTVGALIVGSLSTDGVVAILLAFAAVLLLIVWLVVMASAPGPRDP